MANRKRDARAARTAYDLTHVNKLRAPRFTILSLCLTVGGKSSKTYFPPDATAAAPGGGSDDFHFAPEKETPQVSYELDDAFALIKTAKLELFRRFSEPALWTLDLTKLGPDSYLHGKHLLQWDGRVIKDPDAPQAGTNSNQGMGNDLTALHPELTVQPDFPDGYVTLEHTPYKLRLTVTDGGRDGDCAIAWTYFHILVKKIELELGPKETLPDPGEDEPDLDLQVYEDDDAEALNGSLPAASGPKKSKKIFLTSNIFKNTNAQMHNRSDFTAYEDLWGDGPNIPIVAKVTIRDSGDNPVDAPKAIGKVRFLWDAVDVEESQGSVYSSHHAAAKAFLDDSVNYYKDTARPKGDNCHEDRGGKRGVDTTSLFPDQDGYGHGFGGEFDSDPQQNDLKDREFPFRVEACDPRKWSAYSYAWTKGKVAGKTGVLFQPSRMAGDAYKVTVYLAWDKTYAHDEESIVLDTDDPLKKVDAAIQATTGTFEVWRRLNFVQYLKKKSAITPNFDMATFQDYYKQAFVQVKDTSGGATEMDKDDYDAKVTAAVTAQPWYVKLMVSTVASQYDAGNHGVDFRSYNDFKAAAMAEQGWNNAQLNGWLAPNLDTNIKYNGYCSSVAESILTNVCEQYMDPDDGINLFQFIEHYNLGSLPGGERLNGFAPGTAVGPKKDETTNTQCLFVLCASPGAYTPTPTNKNTPEQTVTHEIGHCLFMAHAPSPDLVGVTDEANKPDPDVHDKDFNHCTMSYNFDAERKWCGFCILRLRGWDRAQLKNDHTQNKKP